jgi:hypothetical protein
MSIVGNIPTRNAELVELENPSTSQSPDLGYPYCDSKFEGKMELSSVLGGDLKMKAIGGAFTS